MDILPILGLVLVSVLPWVIVRAGAEEQNRAGVTVFILFFAEFINLTVGSYESFSGYSPIGKWNAFLTWLLLVLAIYEVILLSVSRSIKRKENLDLLKNGAEISNTSKKLLIIVTLYSSIYILSSILYDGYILFTFLYVFISIILIAVAKPSIDSCSSLGYFGVIVTATTLLNLIFGIVSPNTSFNTKPEYGLAPYKNFTWDLVGIDERFRGAFPHPNTVGAYLTFSILLMLIFSSKRIKIIFVPIAYFLIWLAASRTSEIDATFLVAYYILFIRLELKISRFVTIPLFATFTLLVTHADTTGSGRTNNYIKGFNWWLDNPLLGAGISLKKDTLVENSLISSLICFGIAGGVSMLAIYYYSFKSIFQAKDKKRKIAVMTSIAFMISSNLEAIFSGAWDLGLLYIFLFVILLNDTVPTNFLKNSPAPGA